MIAAPTFTVSPSATSMRVITPLKGEGMATTALSVSSSSNVWSASTVSPTATTTAMTVPSVTPSDTSGTRISWAMSFLLLLSPGAG